MERQNSKSVKEKYDDMTANLFAGTEYATEAPSFEEFSEFYLLLVQRFFHNAAIGKWPLVTNAHESASKTPEELHEEWSERITSWSDVEAYMTDWIDDRIDYPTT